MEKPPSVVTRQRVRPVKKQRSRELRRLLTTEEAMLWEHLRDNGVGYRFRRQQVIAGFIVDFYCHQAGLAVEVDGGVHDERKIYDGERDKMLVTRGIRVLRFRNHEIRNDLGRVLEHITDSCRETWNPR